MFAHDDTRQPERRAPREPLVFPDPDDIAVPVNWGLADFEDILPRRFDLAEPQATNRRGTSADSCG